MVVSQEDVVEALIENAFKLIDANEWERLGEVFSPGFTDHMGTSTAHGIDEFVAAVAPFYAMVPGLTHEVFDVRELGAGYYVFAARAAGPGLDVTVANAVRVSDGLVEEHWGPGERAMGEIMTQLGISMPS